MNKKGDVPIVVLVIGVLIICLLALVSFFISGTFVKGALTSVTLVDKVVMEHEKISVYSDMGLSKSQIDTLLNVQSDKIEGRFIEREQKGLKVRYNLGQ